MTSEPFPFLRLFAYSLIIPFKSSVARIVIVHTCVSLLCNGLICPGPYKKETEKRKESSFG